MLSIESVYHHGWEIDNTHHNPPWWYACTEPERIPDDYTVWVSGCDGCQIGLVAAVASGRTKGDHNHGGYLTPTHLAICLQEARKWRAEHGLVAI
jgi:hypothetical protein